MEIETSFEVSQHIEVASDMIILLYNEMRIIHIPKKCIIFVYLLQK